MSTDHIRYDLLVQDALKNVVRKVLGDAMRDGLPGEHHFYISFRTGHPTVKLSARLRERYPEEMTVVLQHQFDNLVVNESGFEVGLSFSGVPERLRVPFDALSGFFDPSVQFGLKFEATEAGEAEVPADVSTLGARRIEDGKKPKVVPAAKPAAAVPAEAPGGNEAGAEVVSLDAFRKKN